MSHRRFLIAITGASSVLYGIRLLEVLREQADVESHLIVSRAAGITLRLECPERSLDSVRDLADVVYKENNIAATPASGTYPFEAMIVVPASMKTLAQIAHGTGESLICRAADVSLKERRPLIVVPRETPLHLGHLRNLTTLAEMGAIVVPPLVALYHQPKTIVDVVDHTVGKICDLMKIDHGLYPAWEGPTRASQD